MTDALDDPGVASKYAAKFVANHGRHSSEQSSLDEKAELISNAMKVAALEALPVRMARAQRPWISRQTLDLIEERRQARADANAALEQRLHGDIKRAARADRKAWLLDNLSSGSWASVRQLRSGFKPNRGRLQNSAGELVSSEERPNTLAEYYANIQWQVRFPELLPEDLEPLGDLLPVSDSPFTMDELHAVLQALKTRKASGADDVPPELWRALADDAEAMTILLDLCQSCWRQRDVPKQWCTARVVAIFKKGDDALPENYRPISLLAVGYKVLASLLLRRIQAGGSEQRIRESQYGFRPKRGTSDAIFLARRLIDAALERNDGKLLLLMLDWQKAFDRIKSKALLQALRRFGLPSHVVDMVGAIYSSRSFVVREHSLDSDVHTQAAGIAQGCPLSPYLFVIVMSVLMADVDRKMYDALQVAPTQPFLVTRDILYADDTLLAATDPCTLQKHLDCIADVGRKYGLELHWGKTILLQVRHDGTIHAADGTELKVQDRAVYLGALLAASGDPKQELSRRLGEAKAAFAKLTQIWSHANLTLKNKLQIYESCILSKLMYGLESLWLRKAERKRLDSFHVSCLRRACRIPPSYASRVSNDVVLQRAGARPLSSTLLQRQLQQFGKIYRMNDSSLIRDITFSQHGVEVRKWYFKRRPGRPRQTWAGCVQHEAYAVARRTGESLEVLMSNEARWNRSIAKYLE